MKRYGVYKYIYLYLNSRIKPKSYSNPKKCQTVCHQNASLKMPSQPPYGYPGFPTFLGIFLKGAIFILNMTKVIWLSKTPISIKWCFHALSFFFLLSFFQVLASHPHETIHIVFSLWDITLQPPASHLFFGEKLASAKLAASNMSHKQYIMYMYEHRYRFFSSYRFLE